MWSPSSNMYTRSADASELQVWTAQHGLAHESGGPLSGTLLTAFAVHVHASGLLVRP